MAHVDTAECDANSSTAHSRYGGWMWLLDGHCDALVGDDESLSEKIWGDVI